ncbi:MAG: hypothetical protein WBF06_04155 [Candidatus Acidiferrales bacterium]
MSLTGFFPELVRNGRIQMRPKRMLAAASICAVVSFTTYLNYRHPFMPEALLELFVNAGVTVLILGGGILCLQSIHREKELNTFDYQRITRLTPLELTLGKLFGAPSLAYFIVLCLAPITLAAAFLSGVSLVTILWIYAIVLLGTITYHAFALLVSLMAGRGSSAGIIIFFLIAVYVSAFVEGDRSSMLALRMISPYFAAQLPRASDAPNPWVVGPRLPGGKDLLFGVTVPHVLVLVALYVTLTGWFLLALTRNIKRDPSMYEIYSPLQAFGFVLYLHLIVLAFYQWTRLFSHWTSGASPYFSADENQVAPAQAEHEILAFSLAIFIIFGLMLLRNRERVRHRILRLGEGAVSWWAALWPGPYLLGGVLTVGLAMIAMIWHKLHPETEWSFGMAFFQVCFLAAWVTRDAIYLQWMNLRRGRRSLTAGLIYLIVFYVCSSALWAGLSFYRAEGRTFGAFNAYLVPWTIFGMDFDSWMGASRIWLGALAILAGEALVFAALQRSQLMKLRESASV